MGVRSLLAMSLIGGAFVCLPQFDVARALHLIAAERVSNLYLVPTLYHDLVNHPDFARADVTSVRKLGFAGAPMTDALLQKLDAAFRPDLFVNHYGSTEIYSFTIDQKAARKPGSAGRAGINQMVRVVRLGAKSTDEAAAQGEEGEIAALIAGDESFEGYWRRPDADAAAIRNGWYFTGDTGLVDADGYLFVTGRVDDLIITGGENVSPVEIESCLSLHPAVAEVAVAGLPDERWGKIVCAFVKRRAAVEPAELDAYCRSSGLANFKRPRRYEFVAEIPKSLRSASFCGESSLPATIGPSAAPPTTTARARNKDDLYEHAQFFPDDLCRCAAYSPRRLPRRDRSGAGTGRRDPRPAAAERHRNAAARPVAACVRGSRRGRACPRDRPTRYRRSFLQWRQHQGLPGSFPRACLQARLEHRRAGALRKASDRRQPRLLLRRRLRNLARL
jgi:2-furoate---CoA ligase